MPTPRPTANLSPEAIRRLSAPVPRYTSYPTANHFTDRVGVAEHVRWLEAVAPGADLSLYVHIPFCTTLCWYCACNTRAVRRYDPVAAYLDPLIREIEAVARRLPEHRVAHIHWGGGSPDILSPADIERLGTRLRERFSFADRPEFAVEIDPRLLRADQVRAFAGAGVDRISLGVQDFDPTVQAAIGREQSLAATRAAIEDFRARGIASVNIDLVYGLPHQTLASAEATIRDVVSLSPDRIAIFGYAHLPQRMKNQRLIDEAALPSPPLRLALARTLADALVAAGYRRIGIDHFAKPTDPLATRPLARNFQGYTTDAAGTLIGLGASAISTLPGGFVQNAVATGEYTRRIREHGLATARGIALTDDDRLRAFVIERLMCDFAFSREAVIERFGAAARPVLAIAAEICQSDADGLVEATPSGFRITEPGRPFARAVCARFDARLGRSAARHSQAV